MEAEEENKEDITIIDESVDLSKQENKEKVVTETTGVEYYVDVKK